MTIPFDEIRRWMFERALPYWADRGLDTKYGGFLEELTPDGHETDVAFKRVRVTCRQIYVFSHAHMLGWGPGDALAKRGYDYLIAKAWQGDERGWARRLTRQGEVLDGTPDLYDIAFALFAFAWRYRASGDVEALKWAHRTLDFVEQKMRAPNGIGYWHELPPQGPRVQNPHMHLFEASLAAFDASKDQRFLDRATEMATLFRERFFDGHTLGEYFTEDFRRVAGDDGHRCEPGHQLEWAWILANYQGHTGVDLQREATTLVDFAEQHGIDPDSQAVFDEVRDDGSPLRKSSRTWPNTERVKGNLALFERYGRDTRKHVAASARLLLDRYCQANGSWVDQFDEAGEPTTLIAPTSTFYHVFLAFAEILRLEPKLTQLG